MNPSTDTEQLVPPDVKDQLSDALQKAHDFITAEMGIPPPLLNLSLLYTDNRKLWWHGTYKHPEWEWELAVRESAETLETLCKRLSKQVARSETLHKLETENE